MIVIINGNRVIATATDEYNGPDDYLVAPADFDEARTYEYVVVDGQLVLPWAKINKDTAKQLLADTDWAATVDITNPEYSNPYLTNQSEFLAYRSTVRAVAVTPPSTEYVFSAPPEPTWGGV